MSLMEEGEGCAPVESDGCSEESVYPEHHCHEEKEDYDRADPNRTAQGGWLYRAYE